MAVMQMQRMNLIAMKQNRKEILERLQELGVLEIDVKLGKKVKVEKLDTAEDRSAFEKMAATADQALDIISKYDPEKTSLFDSLAGKPLVEYEEYAKTEKEYEFLIKQAQAIIECERVIAEATSNIQKYENQMESLIPWMGVTVPMSMDGTKCTSLFIGMIADAVSKEQIQEKLYSKDQELGPVEITVLGAEKTVTYIGVICLKTKADQVEEALRSISFSRPAGIVAGIPREEEARLRLAIGHEEEKIKSQTLQIVEYGTYRNQLKLVSDYCRMRADRYGVLGQLPQTAATFALSGYIPEEIASKVVEEMEDRFGAAVSLEGIKAKEEPPVLLKNNGFSNSVEEVVASYGLPKKGEIDPTTVVSFFYVFFFGLMLSDAAYGALIAIVCGFAVLKFPRMEASLKKSLKMFFWCGISTLFWGLMFGGFFGDIITVVSGNYFGKEIITPALWFVPLNDPVRLLVYSLLFGVIHMFTGLGLKGYMALKQRDYKAFVYDVMGWALFLVGLLLILLPSEIFESISQIDFNFPAFMQPLAIGLAVAGFLILLLFAGRRKKKKIVSRLLIGAYEIYGIANWLSDCLSYSRLLALGLATGVIASVVNEIGTMFGTGVLGTIIFIVVFIIGHTFNLAINLLGAYVHTNRLQYVEFFGKFYEGGGRPFEPFKAFTKYVEFKNKNF